MHLSSYLHLHICVGVRSATTFNFRWLVFRSTPSWQNILFKSDCVVQENGTNGNTEKDFILWYRSGWSEGESGKWMNENIIFISFGSHERNSSNPMTHLTFLAINFFTIRSLLRGYFHFETKLKVWFWLTRARNQWNYNEGIISSKRQHNQSKRKINQSEKIAPTSTAICQKVCARTNAW